MDLLSFSRRLVSEIKIKFRKKLKPGDLSRAFINQKKISLVANTNGGFANSYRTVIAASMVSEAFEVKVNEIKFHPVENVDFFVNELGFTRNSTDDLPKYGGWIIPHVTFYGDYRDNHCFNLLNQYGLYHDVCEMALYPEYHQFILEKSKFKTILEKFSIDQDLSKTLGVQLRVWDEEPANSTRLLDSCYAYYKELTWGSLILHNVVNAQSLNLLADKIERVCREANAVSVFLSCNKRDPYKKLKIILEGRGIVVCNPENTFEIAPDVFEFIVLSNCRSILRSPGSTYGHLASIFRKELSNDFMI